MHLLEFLTCISIAVVASAGNTVLHERRTSAPSGFVSHGAAPPNEMLTLRLALASNDASGLDAKLSSLATPGSPEFRQWLSMEEVLHLS